MSKAADKTGAKDQSSSISQKIQKLDEAVDWFYGEDFNLDQALEKYHIADQLVKEINADLDQLKNQVEVIADLTKENGN